MTLLTTFFPCARTCGSSGGLLRLVREMGAAPLQVQRLHEST